MLSRVSRRAAVSALQTKNHESLRTAAPKRVASAPTNLKRLIHMSSKCMEAVGAKTLNVDQKENAEYHMGSTRYSTTDRETLKSLDITAPVLHKESKSMSDQLAWGLVRLLRIITDLYFRDNLLKRAVMLETVAAVPPMVGGMTHHLSSLSKMRQDNWIKALLDEAENERMHLMTFIQITKPSFFDRMLILAVQGVVWNLYFICYLISPRTCHRFVGYLEEEAVKTYTKFLKMIDAGKIANVPAPKIAKDYWGLPEDASLRDVVLVIRADEMDHRDVNHTVSDTLLRLNNDQYPGEGEININPSQLYSMDEAIKQSGNTPLKERQ